MRKLGFKILPYAIVIALAWPVISFFVPSEDVLRVTSVDVVRKDDDGARGEDPKKTRDVYEIYAETPVTKEPRIFYNEDAYPYLKWNSGDVQSAAASIAADKGIAAINSQGWRISIISMVPNALGVKRVSEDYRPFPLQLVVYGLFISLLLGLRFAVKRALKQRRARADAKRSAEAAARARAEEERKRSSGAAGDNGLEAFLRGEETK